MTHIDSTMLRGEGSTFILCMKVMIRRLEQLTRSFAYDISSLTFGNETNHSSNPAMDLPTFIYIYIYISWRRYTKYYIIIKTRFERFMRETSNKIFVERWKAFCYINITNILCGYSLVGSVLLYYPSNLIINKQSSKDSISPVGATITTVSE